MRRMLFLAGLVCLALPTAMAQQSGEKPAAKQDATTEAQPAVPQQRSAEILRSFHTIHVQTGTWLAKPEMCEGALQKHREFEDWDLSIVRNAAADVILKIDHQPGWFYYQYSMVHSASSLVLAAGNVTAWDGKVACNNVADKIIERIKRVRPLPESEDKKKKKKD